MLVDLKEQKKEAWEHQQKRGPCLLIPREFQERKWYLVLSQPLAA